MDLLQEHNGYCNAGNLSASAEYQEHGVKPLLKDYKEAGCKSTMFISSLLINPGNKIISQLSF